MASKNRQTFVCNMISATVQRANLNPMDRARMDDNVCKLVDQLGACERIFRSPIPLVPESGLRAERSCKLKRGGIWAPAASSGIGTDPVWSEKLPESFRKASVKVRKTSEKHVKIAIL